MGTYSHTYDKPRPPVLKRRFALLRILGLYSRVLWGSWTNHELSSNEFPGIPSNLGIPRIGAEDVKVGASVILQLGIVTRSGAHRLLSSSFLGLPYRILNMNHKKELLRSLWVDIPKP